MEQESGHQKNRLLIHESVMPIYRELTYGKISDKTGQENTNREQSPFLTYRDLFLLAACYGFQNQRGKRKPLPEGKKTDIRTEVFGDDGLATLKAIAIAETGDVGILSDSMNMLTIAEEYSHIGIQELRLMLLDNHGLPLWKASQL